MSILERITALGQSIWFDDLRRDLVTDGELGRLVTEDSVTGVTTNPTILAKAISESSAYEHQLQQLIGDGSSVDELYRELVTTDIRAACDVLAPVWERTRGGDGFVSVEVSPAVAHEAGATIAEVREWVKRIDRSNLLVKIPATEAGASAFEDLTAEGVSINVTLIFSLERYRDIAERYVTGIERFVAAGGDPSKVHSVASFFVSRVDTEVDSRLKALTASANSVRLRGKTGIANARVAYGIFQDVVASDRWQSLASKGATVQRPLWASTGVKDPSYPDTMYVDDLVAPHTVNTMPLKTLRAVADHGDPGDGFSADDVAAAQILLAEVQEVGVDLDDVTAQIEREGLEKFSNSFDEITALLDERIGGAGRNNRSERA